LSRQTCCYSFVADAATGLPGSSLVNFSAGSYTTATGKEYPH
jgi:hypothetical protein